MINLDVVKLHLRVDHIEEDTLIQAYTDAAFSAFELWTNRTLLAAAVPLPDPITNHIALSKSIEQGALLLIGHWYASREAVVIGTITAQLPMATMALWLPHRWVNV